MNMVLVSFSSPKDTWHENLEKKIYFWIMILELQSMFGQLHYSRPKVRQKCACQPGSRVRRSRQRTRHNPQGWTPRDQLPLATPHMHTINTQYNNSFQFSFNAIKHTLSFFCLFIASEKYLLIIWYQIIFKSLVSYTTIVSP